MKTLDYLDKKFGRFSIANVTLYLIAGQTFFYVMYLTGKLQPGITVLSPLLLLQGEWWRLLTFIFDPPRQGPVFVLFAWYLFYLMGSALENHWGSFRYNLFLISGYIFTVAISFLMPSVAVTNTFIGVSVFLAFAFLYPDFIINIFFFIPVRMKWLAMLTWFGYAYLLLLGSWSDRLMILASLGNFLLFFASDITWLVKHRQRTLSRNASMARKQKEPFHRCSTCGITDKSHPQMDFRYCPQCEGQYGYCKEHIFKHDHVKK